MINGVIPAVLAVSTDRILRAEYYAFSPLMGKRTDRQ